MKAPAADVSAAGVIAGNVYDKYGTRNPLARGLVTGFERTMDELLDLAEPVTSVLEVGCGEGHVTDRLTRRFPRARVRGSDVSPEIVAQARARYPACTFEVGSIYKVGADGARYDLVVACEVLEHLADPAAALAGLSRAAGGHLFVSVPREPLWRALNLLRGRYWRALGDTPGHVQHWSSTAFLALLRTRFDVIAVRRPLPWTQALCRSRG